MPSRSRFMFFIAGCTLASLLFAFVESTNAACCKCKPANSEAAVCLTDPTFNCSEIIGGAQNQAIQGYTCESTALSDTACNPINSNPSAVCTTGPTAAATYKPPAAGSSGGSSVETFEQIPFKLNVPIPGLKFSPVYTYKSGDALVLSIPFFAEYVNAAYRYLLGIVVLTASIMLIWGGFHYILGTTLSSVSRGKKIIRDALIGLVLAFSSYTILNILNPATTTLNAIDVRFIEQVKPGFNTISTNGYYSALKAEGNTSVPQGLGSDAGPSGQLNPSQGGAPPSYAGQGTMQSGTCTLTLNQAGIPTVLSLYKCGIQIAKEVGIPPCYVVTAINHESYLALPNLAGHDENVTAKVGKNGGLIDARKKFLASGVTFKGNPITGDNMMNDDVIDYSKEDLGFDKRFSHGGGIMGMTIPCIGGKCYTQRDRLDPYKGMEGPILGIKAAITQSKLNPTDPAAVRKIWDLYRGVDPPKRTAETLECFKRKDPLEMILPIQFIICRGDLPLDKAGCEAEVKSLKSQGYPVMNGACNTICPDSRMPIKREKGTYVIRNPPQ